MSNFFLKYTLSSLQKINRVIINKKKQSCPFLMDDKRVEREMERERER